MAFSLNAGALVIFTYLVMFQVIFHLIYCL
jgi:hypothetical protein